MSWMPIMKRCSMNRLAMGSKEIILAQWKHETNTQFSNTWIQGLIPNVNNDKNQMNLQIRR